MIRKIIKQLQNGSQKSGESELQAIYDDIERKNKELAEKKDKFNQEYNDGSRLSKHRFTL